MLVAYPVVSRPTGGHIEYDSPHFFAAVTMTLYLLSTAISPLLSTHRWVLVFGALALRPWRALAGTAPPWPALAWWAALPLLWSLDAVTKQPLLQPLSGACLLSLMAGWPLTMLALLPVAGVTMSRRVSAGGGDGA